MFTIRSIYATVLCVTITSFVQCGLLDWIKGKKKPEIKHHVPEKKVEEMNAAEWLQEFASIKDVNQFSMNSELLSQQIFLGIYPSGWLTDKISLNTLMNDAQGMYQRYSQVLNTQREDTVGWFRMINNALFHIDNAATVDEENTKIKQVEARKQEWAKVKETLQSLKKLQGERAYNNMKDLISKYWGTQLHWLGAEQQKATVADNPQGLIAKASRAYTFFTQSPQYKENFTKPLKEIKQYTVTLFKHIKNFLLEKQKFPQSYLNLTITPEQIKNERDATIKKVRNSVSDQEIERMKIIIQTYRDNIKKLTNNIQSANAAISQSIQKLPQEWQSQSMLMATYKAQLIAINLHKAAERVQFGINNEYYIVHAVNKQIQNEKVPPQPAQVTQTNYSNVLSYIDPRQWFSSLWG